MVSPPVLSRVVKTKVAFQVLQTDVLIHPAHAGIELVFLSCSLLSLQN